MTLFSSTLPVRHDALALAVGQLGRAGLRVLLCLLLCLVSVQGMQALAAAPAEAINGLCIEQCAADALDDVDEVRASEQGSVLCSDDAPWACEPDGYDREALPRWHPAVFVVLWKPFFHPLVPVPEFHLSPLLRPPRAAA